MSRIQPDSSRVVRFGSYELDRATGELRKRGVRVKLQELAYLRSPSKAVILGHVIAHGLGHLFLGPRSHSSEGLMGFPWAKKQLRMAAEGSLNFTAKQVEGILK